MLAAVFCGPSRADTLGAARVQAGDARGLERQLIELADHWLGPSGLSIDAGRSRLILTGPFTAGQFDVIPLWPANGVPQLPLSFELRGVAAIDREGAGVVRATLVTALMREMAVTRHRVKKGSPLTCEDIATARLPLRMQGKRPLGLPCEPKDNVVALREIGFGDAVDESDVGDANGVFSGESVDVRLRAGAITITTVGTALSDARLGDAAQVQLRHPRRTLQARVVGRSVVELQEQIQ